MSSWSDVFRSFFCGFWRPNLITGLSRWWAPDSSLRTNETVLDLRTGAYLFLDRPNQVPCWWVKPFTMLGWAGMYPRTNQSPQSISLTTKKRNARGMVPSHWRRKGTSRPNVLQAALVNVVTEILFGVDNKRYRQFCFQIYIKGLVQVGWELTKARVRLFLINFFCTADPFPRTNFSQLWRRKNCGGKIKGIWGGFVDEKEHRKAQLQFFQVSGLIWVGRKK